MITIAKLNSLKDRTCVRKCASLFHQLSVQEQVDELYLSGLVSLFEGKQFHSVLDEDQLYYLNSLAAQLPNKKGKDFSILLEDMHYFLLSVLGSDPSDWDLVDEEGNLDTQKRIILPHILVLDRLRSPYNIGSIFRSADSFGIQKIYLIEGCASIDHPRARKTSRGCIDTVASEVISEEEMVKKLAELALPVFALETGGTELSDFPFPQEGVGIIGGEELGVSPSLLHYSETSLGRLSLAMAGTKGSLNVAVATGIMLYSWFSR